MTSVFGIPGIESCSLKVLWKAASRITSKGNVVIGRWFLTAFLRSDRWRCLAARRRRRTVFRTTAAIIEELERLHHDAEFAPLLAGLFIFPGIEPQAAFDHD